MRKCFYTPSHFDSPNKWFLEWAEVEKLVTGYVQTLYWVLTAKLGPAREDKKETKYDDDSKGQFDSGIHRILGEFGTRPSGF